MPKSTLNVRFYISFIRWDVALTWCLLHILALAELRDPKIVQGLKDTVAKKGQQTEFQVKVRGQPMPDVEWSVDTLKVDVLMS